MRATIYCEGEIVPSLISATEAGCFDGVTYQQVLVEQGVGLSALTWPQVEQLAGALLISVCLAVGYNLLAKSIWDK